MSYVNAWAAGFFDGEGSIGIEGRADRPGRFKLTLTVVQKYPEPLNRLAVLFGGHVDFQEGSGTRGTPRWRWRVQHRAALRALQAMRPYLIVKAAEADVAISFQERRSQGRKDADTSLDVRDKELLTKLKTLPIAEREGVTSRVPVAA